jgi:hypothetical protein
MRAVSYAAYGGGAEGLQVRLLLPHCCDTSF